jgi:16S rRNA (uracil1498-N3)-methyltransferase
MRLNRFFTNRRNLGINSSVKLNESDAKHIRKVLRLSKGKEIILFNGEREYLCELNIVRNDFATAIIKKELRVEKRDSEGSITLFQGLLKSGKFDLIVEKATELGVTNIVPLECEYSQMKSDVARMKVDRWQKIALSASKQSERIKIPDVITPINFSDLETITKEFDTILLLTISRDSDFPTELLSKDLKDSKIGIIIGPEGGFSPGEHAKAKEWGFKFISINNNVLRSETASIAALSIVSFLISN